MKIGSALDESVNFGPLANKTHSNKGMSAFAKAREQNGEVIYGGSTACDEGLFVQPTAILGRSQADTIMIEEAFRPVGSFLAYDDEEEMLHYMT